YRIDGRFRLRCRYVGEQPAPTLELRHAGLARAEQLADQLAAAVVQLQRGDAAIVGGPVHDPALADGVLAQVQVEGRIEHVEPAIADQQLLDRAGVNLHHAGTADEYHDGQSRLGDLLQDG